MEVVTPPASGKSERVAVIYGPDISSDRVVAIKQELVAAGRSVVLAKAQKNAKALYERLVAQGVSEVTTVHTDDTGVDDLVWRRLDR
jgi:hypothetical protein